MFSTFPEEARGNTERQAAEFGVEIGKYRGVVRVPRRVFQRLLPERPTPERCLKPYYLHRTRLELIAERKVRWRLTDDGQRQAKTVFDCESLLKCIRPPIPPRGRLARSVCRLLSKLTSHYPSLWLELFRGLIVFL